MRGDRLLLAVVFFAGAAVALTCVFVVAVVS